MVLKPLFVLDLLSAVKREEGLDFFSESQSNLFGASERSWALCLHLLGLLSILPAFSPTASDAKLSRFLFQVETMLSTHALAGTHL